MRYVPPKVLVTVTSLRRFPSELIQHEAVLLLVTHRSVDRLVIRELPPGSRHRFDRGLRRPHQPRLDVQPHGFACVSVGTAAMCWLHSLADGLPIAGQIGV